MLILAKLIGIYIIIMGIILLVSPKTIKRFVAFFGQGKRIYLAGILRLAFGVILLLAASRCRLVGIVVTLGILTIIGGILVFVLGIERVRALLKWWDKRSPQVIRLFGLVVIAVGALLIYSV